MGSGPRGQGHVTHSPATPPGWGPSRSRSLPSAAPPCASSCSPRLHQRQPRPLLRPSQPAPPPFGHHHTSLHLPWVQHLPLSQRQQRRHCHHRLHRRRRHHSGAGRQGQGQRTAGRTPWVGQTPLVVQVRGQPWLLTQPRRWAVQGRWRARWRDQWARRVRQRGQGRGRVQALPPTPRGLRHQLQCRLQQATQFPAETSGTRRPAHNGTGAVGGQRHGKGVTDFEERYPVNGHGVLMTRSTRSTTAADPTYP